MRPRYPRRMRMLRPCRNALLGVLFHFLTYETINQRLFRFAGLVALAAVWLGLISGCATMADAKNARGAGEAATYKASFEDIWAALPAAVTQAGLEFVSASRDDRSVLAQRGITAFSYGENVAIFVDQARADAQRVEVVSSPTSATGPGFRLFSRSSASQVVDRRRSGSAKRRVVATYPLSRPR